MKLLDFGLAKALEPTPAEGDPTLPASDATREGTVLGTPAYMSPEQARGQVVDRRTDIWAFGCCLYESLSADARFKGSTVTDTLAAVLNSDPDWSALSETCRSRIAPAAPTMSRQGCHDIACSTSATHGSSWRRTDRRTEREPCSTAVADAVGRRGRDAASRGGRDSGCLALEAANGCAARAPVTRLTLKMEGETAGDLRLEVNGFFVPFALSPDGARLVLRAERRQWIAALSPGALRFRDASASWHQHGDDSVLFTRRAMGRVLAARGTHAQKVSIAGGLPIDIAPTDALDFAIWGASDEIVIDTWLARATVVDPGRRRHASSDRHPRSIPGEEIELRGTDPGGKDLLVASVRPQETWIEVLSRETGTRRRLLRGGGQLMRRLHAVPASWSTRMPTRIFTVPVDPERFLPLGPPVPAIHGIDHFYRRANAAISDNGTLAFLPADGVREPELFWLDRAGHITPVPGGRGPFVSAVRSLPTTGRRLRALVNGAKIGGVGPRFGARDDTAAGRRG